jgi:hypothetical protein
MSLNDGGRRRAHGDRDRAAGQFDVQSEIERLAARMFSRAGAFFRRGGDGDARARGST